MLTALDKKITWILCLERPPGEVHLARPSLGSRTARRMCPDRFGADKILFIFNC